jgi:hypothetical protein
MDNSHLHDHEFMTEEEILQKILRESQLDMDQQMSLAIANSLSDGNQGHNIHLNRPDDDMAKVDV